MGNELSKKTRILRAAISLAVSGALLFIAVGFAWFAIFKETQATGLSFTAQAVDCKVEYTLTSDEELVNAKPGDIITYEIRIYDITKTGLLTVRLDGITCDPAIEIEGVYYDIRGLFTVTIILPEDAENKGTSQSMSGKEHMDILQAYSVSENDEVTVRFAFEFLTELPGLEDINAFQGAAGIDISELSVFIN